MSDETVTCHICKATKPLDDFPRDRRRKNGRGSRCFICTRAYSAAHYKANKNRYTERNAKYQAIGAAAEARRRWEERHPERVKQHLRNRKRIEDVIRQSAHRNGHEWTGAEIEIVMRDDLTISEIAAMLGRSYDAVTRRRQIIRAAEPKTLVLTEGAEL